MSTILNRPLVFALASALAVAVLAPAVHADPQRSLRDQRASSRGGDSAQAKQETKPPLYPEATRKQPDTKASQKTMKLLQAMQERYEKDDWAGVIAKAEEINAAGTANAFDKAYAWSMAGNAAANAGDQAKAGEYFSRAVAADGLDNDAHYSTMYNLAIIQYGEEKYADALATVDRFLAETKSSKPEQLSFRAGILAAAGRNEEAAAVYKQLIAQSPDDKRLLMNAVATLQNADKFDEANVLLDAAYKRGMLTEARELRALYVGYMNAGKWAEAQKVMEDGLAKNVLQPGPDLARDYQVLAQTAFAEDNIALAIEMYKRAAPMAADGEAYLNLAKVYDYAGKKADAKAAAKQALAKGIKKPDEANRILAR